MSDYSGYFALFISLLFASINWYLAERKNRNYVAWAVMGFFLGVLSTIVLLCLKKLNTPYKGYFAR